MLAQISTELPPNTAYGSATGRRNPTAELGAAGLASKTALRGGPEVAYSEAAGAVVGITRPATDPEGIRNQSGCIEWPLTRSLNFRNRPTTACHH
jgi:hypothetical protein